jgi:hypothetical protein
MTMTRRPRGEAPELLLRQLQVLQGDLPAQQAYARELLATQRQEQVVLAALRVLDDMLGYDDRSLLTAIYADYDIDGVRRDPGGSVRNALLRAMRPIAIPADLPLAERAVATYEFIPPTRAEEAQPIRAAGLLVLDALDAQLAGFQAVRLLHDTHTALMSGQPALTAVEVLGARGAMLPLYAYAAQRGGQHPDVLAACLRSLSDAPSPILADLVTRYWDAQDELVRFGLYDLILAHSDANAYRTRLIALLRTTYQLSVLRYLSTVIVASRKAAWIAELLAVAEDEHDSTRVGVLLDVLALLPPDPARHDLLEQLARRAQHKRSHR